MSEGAAKRPLLISIVAILLIATGTLGLAGIAYSGLVNHAWFDPQLGAWQTWLNLPRILATLMVGAGLWRMRRWSILLYLLVAMLGIAAWTADEWGWWRRFPHLGLALPFVVPAFVLALTLPSWKRMTWRFP